MGKFGGATAKRHLGWSNDEGFMRDLMARGGYMNAEERRQVAQSLVTRGTSKRGMPTFTGAKQLKKSQTLVCIEAMTGLEQLMKTPTQNIVVHLRRYTATFGHNIVDIFRKRQGAAFLQPD